MNINPEVEIQQYVKKLSNTSSSIVCYHANELIYMFQRCKNIHDAKKLLTYDFRVDYDNGRHANYKLLDIIILFAPDDTSYALYNYLCVFAKAVGIDFNSISTFSQTDLNELLTPKASNKTFDTEYVEYVQQLGVSLIPKAVELMISSYQYNFWKPQTEHRNRAAIYRTAIN